MDVRQGTSHFTNLQIKDMVWLNERHGVIEQEDDVETNCEGTGGGGNHGCSFLISFFFFSSDLAPQGEGVDVIKKWWRWGLVV